MRFLVSFDRACLAVAISFIRAWRRRGGHDDRPDYVSYGSYCVIRNRRSRRSRRGL